MSLVQVLMDAIDLPPSENMNSCMEITNYLLAEYRNVYRPPVSIDIFVDGNITTFAEQINALPVMLEVDNAFPGLKEFVYIHTIEGIGHWDDWNYCSWVAGGMLRYFGRELLSGPPLELHPAYATWEAMG
jgi:hypothetical protein